MAGAESRLSELFLELDEEEVVSALQGEGEREDDLVDNHSILLPQTPEAQHQLKYAPRWTLPKTPEPFSALSPPSRMAAIFGSPPSSSTMLSPRVKEEKELKVVKLGGKLAIHFNTLLDASESFQLEIDGQSETIGLLENIQKKLKKDVKGRRAAFVDDSSDALDKEERAPALSASKTSLLSAFFSPKTTVKGTTPMLKELSVVAAPPFDFCLKQFPLDVCSFLTLQKLALEGNDIGYVPPNISQLVFLEDLRLPQNHIKGLPAEIKSMTALEYLNLNDNQLTAIPSIGTLIKLKELQADSNAITVLPADIGQLKNLELLSMQKNKITTLPAGMETLLSLTHLNLSHNLLTSLNEKKGKEWLGSITNLKFLHIQGNKITSLPVSLGLLTNLTELDISQNQITSLGKEIGSLSALKILNASRNSLSSLPAELSQLLLLEVLQLDGNKFNALPPLEPLAALKVLNLQHNLITDPNQLTHFPPSLEELVMSHNGLTTVPTELSKLPGLSTLDFSHNMISSIPGEFFLSFSSLKTLNLSHNQLKSLPTEFGDLPSIISLDLSENIIISMPPEMKNLKTLRTLALDSSKVTAAPGELPKSLNQLSLANVFVNRETNEVRTTAGQGAVQSLQMALSYSLSTAHPLLTFALANLAQDHRDALVKLGAIDTFFSLAKSEDEEVRCEATRGLAILYYGLEQSTVKNITEEQVKLLFSLSGHSDPATKCQAIFCLGNVACHDPSRELILEKFGMDPLFSLLENVGDERVQMALNRALNIFGAHDYLHFPPLQNRKRGIRILAFDGGGTRALATLEILKKIEDLSGRRIADMFDLMIGTSTGAVLTSLVGIKGYTLDKCESLYKDLSSKVFAIGSKPESDPSSWSRLYNYGIMLKSGAFYKAAPLLEILETFCGSDPLIDTTMDSRVKRVKVAIVSTVSSIVPPQVHLFRNYNYPQGHKSRHPGNFKSEVHLALRGSSAAPSFFPPYEEITTGLTHVDGGLTANNPSALGIHEAKCLWPDREIDLVVSVGTGSAPPVPLKSKTFIQGVMSTLVKSATSPDRIHHTLTDLLPPQKYFRFQPVDPIFATDLDETDEERLFLIQEAARKYASENMDRLQQLADIVKDPIFE